MASSEFLAFQAAAAGRPVPPPPASIQELRDRIDGAMGKLPLAEATQAVEVDAGGVPAILCSRTGGDGHPMIVYFHGGGYRIVSALAYRSYGSHLAKACDARVLMVDYRLAPENPFPAAVDDAIAAYRWVLDQGEAPGRIVVGGDSAGGGLAAALLHAVRARSLPMPAGAVCLSPWADLTNTAETYETRADTDKLFSKTAAEEAAGLYLQDADPSDPLASPVFGDWQGMPPLLIQVGDTEVLMGDAHRLAEAASQAGVDVQHEVYPEMPHVWQVNYPAYPEAVEAVEHIAAFVHRVTT